ncbi:MAG: sulfite exporter TauE/SafE family protein [Acidimicrobiia bacterium]
MLTPGGLVAGALAALFIGISKTGIPGAGILAIPLLALVVSGRLIPGVMIPLLIVADFFAIGWYRRHTRWDLLRPLGLWLGAGFGLGIAYFVVVGSAPGALERTIGAIVVVIVGLQLWMMWRDTEPEPLGPVSTAAYGTAGGFTTFVANAAGPIINTYLAGLRLHKSELLGTAAWLYFVVNVAKIPFYFGLQVWSDGGDFFTAEALVYDLILIPMVVAGALIGRQIYKRIPQRVFLVVILALSALGAINLLI